MLLRNSILILLLPVLFSACFSNAQKKQYSITTWFTSFDTTSASKDKVGKKFKYSYEEYNADSNLIYQELYTNPDAVNRNWGELYEKTKFFYNGKEKIKAERAYGFAPKTGEEEKITNTYEYKNGQLIKWLSNGKPREEYKYNSQNEQIETIYYPLESQYYDHFLYVNGVKLRTEHFHANAVQTIDTFIYNKNHQLIEQYSFDSNGDTIVHRVTTRNDKGLRIEQKWKIPYNEWWMRKDGTIINDEFYESNKYYYDVTDRPGKTEYYKLGKLTTVYEFAYN